MTTLLIGYGLVGHYIADQFETMNSDIVTMDELDKEIENKNSLHINSRVYCSSQLNTICDQHKINSIVIAAGVMSKYIRSYFEEALSKEANMIQSIVTAISNNNRIKRIIYLSSFAVYGSTQRMDERDPISPSSPYGIIKAYNEKLLLQIPGHIDVKIIRPVGVLGPIHGKSGNWMSTALCAIYYDRISPSSIKQLIHADHYVDVREVASLVYHLNFTDLDFSIINIGSTVNRGSKLLIDTINQVWNKKIKAHNNQKKQEINIDRYYELGLSENYMLEDTIKFIGEVYEEC
ncbi:NAD-dependent epimerase/dehydratase family protein [Geomicrobium sp. JSM 1781026]|uniref:NAD-dependent epimerase/dehydratase family protein n=1 Tax=Geomicrobium sp. JSM 1781026 TaxID=3344580 RepID=UPI0035BF7EBE